MGALIPLESGAKLPAYLQNAEALKAINADVLNGSASFFTLSIKSKVFTLVKGKERKTLMRLVDGVEEPKTSLVLGVIRANNKSRQYYSKGYAGEDSEGQRPDCYSHDGITPSNFSPNKQCTKCAICPQAAWGSRVARPGEEGGEGTACSPRVRLAVFDPENPDVEMLFNIPVGSRKAYADEIAKFAENRGIPYNALAMRVSFDHAAAGVKLVFKPAGLLDDAQYATVTAKYDSPEVLEILGLKESAPPVAAAPEVPAASMPEVEKVLATPPTAAPAAKKATAQPAKLAADAGDLLGGLDALLGKKDDAPAA